MIIKTRYRDLPFEQILKCLTAEGVSIVDNARNRAIWESFRGGPVSIITPAIKPNGDCIRCDGPHFRIYQMSHSVVCPHIAEIGD